MKNKHSAYWWLYHAFISAEQKATELTKFSVWFVYRFHVLHLYATIKTTLFLDFAFIICSLNGFVCELLFRKAKKSAEKYFEKISNNFRISKNSLSPISQFEYSWLTRKAAVFRLLLPKFDRNLFFSKTFDLMGVIIFLSHIYSVVSKKS